VQVDRDHESGGVVLESVWPSAKDLLGKDGRVVADQLRAVTTDGSKSLDRSP
jgi:hypothetical protein